MIRPPPEVAAVVAILRCRQGDGRPIGRELDDVDWQAALAFANDELVAPALSAAIEAAGLAHRLPADVRAYLQYLHDQNRARNDFMRRQLLEVVKAWNEAKIVPIVVKGGIALLNGEQALGERMMVDLDFVFEPAEIESAVRVAAMLGYRRHVDYPGGGHALTCLVRAGEPASLDMLLALLHPAELLPVENVRRRALPVQREGSCVVLPSPEDQLMHLVLHDMVHHGRHRSGIMSLRTLTDFARMLKANPQLDWAAIVAELKQRGCHHVLRALAYAARELLGVAPPAIAIGGPAALIYYRRGVSAWRRPAAEHQPRLIRLLFSGLAYKFDPAARIVPFPVKCVRRLLYGPEPTPPRLA